MTKINNKGFSLVELIVVIAILGVMTALVIPKLGASRDSAEVKAAAREFLSNVRYTRDKAITNSTQYTIKVTDKQNNKFTYGIFKGDETSKTLENSFEFPIGIKVDDTDYSVTFAITGNCVTRKNSGTLVISNSDDSVSKSVVVLSATGMAHIE